jgi:uncharacterized protein involved in exopolysaccharide biosynthesis
VFCCSFILACVVSLSYVYMRPAEYRAVARLQITPAGSVAEASDDTKSPVLQDDPKAFLTEVQVLTSRPLLEEVVKRIRTQGKLPGLGQDPVDAVQRMLRAIPLKDTQVVQLSAEGPQQTLVSELVNTVAMVYEQHVTDAYKDRAASTYTDISDEAQTLHNEVLRKQQAVDDFRARYDIVSLDRKENDVLAKIEGLNRSYADSNEQLAKAQGRLQALRNSAAAGKIVVRAKDDPTLANLEQRASMLREQRRELERRYTPEYLALDADARALRARISDIEEQLKEQQAASQRTAIAEADDELSSAQAASNRLRKDLDENQKGAREFAARLAEFKVIQEDLDHLRTMERAVLDRSTKLQSSARERAPRVELVEAAAPSFEPWSPNYTRDALISLVGSIAFGLFATWFADYVRGPAPGRMIGFQHSFGFPPIGRYPAASLRSIAPLQAQLPPPDTVSRELDNVEIGALVSNASDDLHLVLVLLLTGLTATEIVSLRWEQIDFVSEVIGLSGEFARVLHLEQALATLLEQRYRLVPAAAGVIFHNGRAEALSIEELDRQILYCAYDAGLDHPQEVTSATLRHTYLAFLMRQGIRAADISRIVGDIPQEEMVAYMQLPSPRVRLPMEQIVLIHPALRGIVVRATA